MLQFISLAMFAIFIGSSGSSDTAVVADVAIASDDVTSPLVSTDETTGSVQLDDTCEAGCLELVNPQARALCIKWCGL